MSAALVFLVCFTLFMLGKYAALAAGDLFHAVVFGVAELALLAVYFAHLV